MVEAFLTSRSRRDIAATDDIERRAEEEKQKTNTYSFGCIESSALES